MFSSDCPDDLDLDGQVPVELVHGFNSDGGTWTTTRARLASNHPRTRTFTFGYGAHSTEWVTSTSIGQPLAQGIRCLGELSPTGKVAVVAHSMGGLAVRCAAASSCGKTAGVAARLGLVVTLGTPHLGSGFLGPFRAEPSKSRPKLGCGGRAAPAECKILQQVRSEAQRMIPVNSDASRAMGPDSELLADLQPFDQDIPIVALAADVRRGVMLFQIPLTIRGPEGSLGDLVVDVESATAHSTRSETVDCGVWGPQLLGPNDFGLPWKVRCHHLNMTTSELFTTKVSDEIGKFIAGSNP